MLQYSINISLVVVRLQRIGGGSFLVQILYRKRLLSPDLDKSETGSSYLIACLRK